jgi:F420-dependent oxidoreductase-like protein
MTRISFKTAPQHVDWAAMRDFWREADGIDHYSAGWLFDHFYPIFSDPTGPCLEGWVALATLAGHTQRLRLGLMVTGNVYRHPAVLANMAATLDVASEGRLEIGLGAGWNRQECDAYGIPLPPLKERFDRLDEACAVIDGLLTKESTTFDGRYYALTEARCEPKPVQQPRPPLVIGGGGEKRTLRIAARWADQWNLAGGTPDVLGHKVEVLHRHCADVGRDPKDIEVSVQVPVSEPAATAENAAAFVAVGAQHLILTYRPPLDPSQLGPVAEAVASAV